MSFPLSENNSSLPAHRLLRQQEPPRIAIIGAGPVGLEAALYAARLGCKVWVFERDAEVAPDVRAWAHVPMFTPWSANRSPLGATALREAFPKSPPPPADDVHPTGGEFVTRYLEPLARLLGEVVLTETRVVGIGRSYLFPDEFADAPERRKGRRFRLLTRTPRDERIFTADYVLDASGRSHTPNWLGAGGLPALGEMGSRGQIITRIPDALGRDRIHFLGKKTLLVGDGASAAATALMLAEVMELEPHGEFVWATKSSEAFPLSVHLHDPLPRRDLLFKKANLLIAQKNPRLEHLPMTQIEAVHYHLHNAQFQVSLQVNHVTHRRTFDTVVANVGARTDAPTFERFLHPQELGYFTLGAKACAHCEGGFFLAQSRTQIRDTFRAIMSDPELDLYAQEKTRP